MCTCQGPRGPQGLQGIQGEKGDPGTGADQRTAGVNTTSIPAQTDLTFINSALSTGNLVYYGVIQLSSTGAAFITVTPVVNGVAQASAALVSVITTKSGLGKLVISVMGFEPINITDTFQLRIEVDDYAMNVEAAGRINYNIQ